MLRFFVSLLVGITFCLSPAKAQVSTCFEIRSIYVDACGSGQQEGLNEFIIFETGPSPLNAADLQATFPNNPWSGVCLNASSQAKVAAINQTITSCGSFLEPPAGIIPPFSTVYLFTSISFDPTTFSFAGLSEQVYALFHCGNNASGNFANFGTGTRTLSMSFTSPANCSDQTTYDRALLVNETGQSAAGNGARVEFSDNGQATYTNVGCAIPAGSGVPSSNWTVPAPLCSNAAPINLNALVTGTPGGTWSGEGVSNGFFNPAGLSGLVSITYTVGPPACESSSEQAITVNEAGNASWEAPVLLCNPQSPIDLNAWITGTPGGTWSGSGVSGSTFSAAGLSGIVTLTYAVGSGLCEASLEQSFPILSEVVAPSVSGETELCEGENTTFTAEVLPGAEVSWYADAALTQEINTGTAYNLTVDQSTVLYITQGFPGCVSEPATVTLTVTPIPAAPQSLSSVSYCEGEALPQLTAVSAFPVLWFDDADLNNALQAGLTFTPTESALPDVFVVSVAGIDCYSSPVQVTLNEQPAAVAEIVNAAPVESCAFEPVILGASGNGTFSWSTGENSEAITITQPGTYILTATTCNTATDTITFVSNAVTANFDLSTTDGIAPLTVTAISSSINSDNCVWFLNNEEGLVDDNTPFSLTEEGVYTLRLVCTNNEGCSNEFTRTITVASGVLSVAIPNSFTPNGDGFNDSFRPTLKGIQDLSFTIFNRWGNQVFTYTDPQGVWDGFVNGNPSPDGVYFYVMKARDLNGNAVEKAGSITVKR